MNIEFHYYLTKYIALEAGFDSDEAEIIAYSSQFVDDNKTRFKIEIPDGSFYENYFSQTMNITKPKKKLMRVYLLFHFLPGDPTSSKARRRDGKMHLLMTTPSSTHAQEIFFDTTKNENLYSLGIASHMLADTLAHQNFVGTFDEINAMKGVWQTLTPNIGHADAGFKPDIPNLLWHDPRLIDEYKEVNNIDRVLLAANKLYTNYLMFTTNPPEWSKVKKNISNIINEPIKESQIKLYPKQKKVRIEKYKELLADFGTDGNYDSLSWFKSAVKEDINFLNDKKYKFDPIKDKLNFRTNYKRSHWYRFQEAIKEYQRIATTKLEPILKQIEIKEW